MDSPKKKLELIFFPVLSMYSSFYICSGTSVRCMTRRYLTYSVGQLCKRKRTTTNPTHKQKKPNMVSLTNRARKRKKKAASK